MTSKLIVCLASVFLLFNCQTTPKIEPLDQSADVSNEISNLNAKIAAAVNEQINVLAPRSYRNAKDHLKEAERLRDKGSSNASALREVEKGYAWIRQANEIGQPRREEFKEILQTRSEALNAGAAKYASTELSRADDQFEDYTRTESSFKINLKDREKIQNDYIQTHATAVKNHYLAQARADVQKARSEGAAAMVPKTLASVEANLQSAETFATANYYKEAEVAAAAKRAEESASRLLVLTRDARVSKNKTPEQIALDQEAANREIETGKREISEKEQALTRETAEANALKRLDEKEATVRAMFAPNEAEVIRANDAVIIRLSGLHFASGKAALTPADFKVLTKAREAVKILGATTFVVEGHTDAVGSSAQNKKISEQRAEAVKEYFEASGDLNNVSIVSEGVGDQKPISSNKTRIGRAQNRRVDLILRDQGEVQQTR